MGHPRYSAKEIVARGRELYERKLRGELERDHTGEYVVINIETGEYEVDRDHLAASDRAAARFASAPLYTNRIGHANIGRMAESVSEPCNVPTASTLSTAGLWEHTVLLQNAPRGERLWTHDVNANCC